jgi:phosphopantothenoylcysteine decarboxylase/phosphopantothenate--cysteine ligase
MKVVVVGVTGSVAAYRAADVCRELMRSGFTVRVCLSRGAEQFVSRALFEALTGGPALTDVFDEPVRGRMAHIDWAREAACILVCPATANAIALLAEGRAEDMFTTLVSASDAPLVIAPAMNPQMFASGANQENIYRLRARGAEIIEPAEGDVACGEQGQGKLASIGSIVEAVEQASFRSSLFESKHVVVTAGPTREHIDPVRFLSNRSSGKMGFALARAALAMGAKVTLITGPVMEVAPPKAEVVRVETAAEMLDATVAACGTADLLVGAAAVADYRVAGAATEKLKKTGRTSLDLLPNIDILKTIRQRYPELAVIGFAAETNSHEEYALKKLKEKGLQGIVANDVSRRDVGFDANDNEGVLYFDDGSRVELQKSSKFNIANLILEAAARFMRYE